MHRNTFIFIIFLAILSAIIAGINISNRLNPSLPPTPTPSGQTVLLSPTTTLQPISQSESTASAVYDNSYCGISLTYDATVLEVRNDASNSAMFIAKTNPQDTVALGCQEDIPRPALALSAIETRVIASVSATVYHDSSAKDGTKIDAVIFTHPKNKLDIYLAGYGKTFNDLITTLTVK